MGEPIRLGSEVNFRRQDSRRNCHHLQSTILGREKVRLGEAQIQPRAAQERVPRQTDADFQRGQAEASLELAKNFAWGQVESTPELVVAELEPGLMEAVVYFGQGQAACPKPDHLERAGFDLAEAGVEAYSHLEPLVILEGAGLGGLQVEAHSDLEWVEFLEWVQAEVTDCLGQVEVEVYPPPNSVPILLEEAGLGWAQAGIRSDLEIAEFVEIAEAQVKGCLEKVEVFPSLR